MVIHRINATVTVIILRITIFDNAAVVRINTCMRNVSIIFISISITISVTTIIILDISIISIAIR